MMKVRTEDLGVLGEGVVHVFAEDPSPANGIAGADAFTVMLLLVGAQPGNRERPVPSCTNCTLYAITELNLRQEPSLDAAVLRFIPAGAAVHRTSGAESNGYAPVTYDGVSGWAVALGLVATPEEVDAAAVPTTTAPATAARDHARGHQRDPRDAHPADAAQRSSADAEPIQVMPEGARLTLTREGAENGYVTVDYDGETGGSTPI